ncbi:flagellar assembly protein FliH [methanotrophic endosymbiont of Bathymodiolus puteoserpentis (Logatchev)]|jgi:flagellar assembly protein FliH|uniref:flagellar assembly protein FliH n=1 Tax=methanotrophic endosymbiont of Bathymodiolus puteoserpentis (Logatchev) TaxID=343235 RepID=UPI0013C68D66|nr:flagellar assembly protein FliH [methanotrophic endosymbiont of Bathymodiolus puteoserpentis (Logatchev)]SHE21934.1 Flagellar assembly protein FliH [methanotrophic endosymbiont of Bathymodiolus puteoserpentis (Logatchev)]
MTSSKGRNFSQDELDALSLWDVPDVLERRSEDVSLDDTVSPVLTVEQIEIMQTQAYDEAFAKGKEEGYKVGFSEGKELGKAEGRAEGLEQGYAENKHLLQEQVARFISLLESLTEPFAQLDEQVEQSLTQLAIIIAKQVVRRELKLDPKQIIAVVKETVKALPVARQKITLAVHPEDAELVRASLSLDADAPAWVIEEDPLLTRGGCIVSTETSHINATVENKLNTIIATVLGDERQGDSE